MRVPLRATTKEERCPSGRRVASSHHSCTPGQPHPDRTGHPTTRHAGFPRGEDRPPQPMQACDSAQARTYQVVPAPGRCRPEAGPTPELAGAGCGQVRSRAERTAQLRLGHTDSSRPVRLARTAPPVDVSRSLCALNRRPRRCCCRVREKLRSVAASLGNAHQEGEDLAQAFEQLGAEGRARSTRSVIDAIESQQATTAGLDATIEEIQGAVEALRGAGGGGGGTPPGTPPSQASLPEPEADPRSSSTPPETRPTAEVTWPRFAPDPARCPSGAVTKIEGKETKRRSLEKENESAQILARAGYDVEQNPPPKPNGKEPDYRIQGEYWDCYAPSGNSPRTVYSQLYDKVREGQAERIVLNLELSGASREDIRARLERYPIRGLQEIKIIKQGMITQFYPWESEASPHVD